jgi:hypothetical protein
MVLHNIHPTTTQYPRNVDVSAPVKGPLPSDHYLYRRREKSVKCKMCGGIPAIRIRAAIDLRLYCI